MRRIRVTAGQDAPTRSRAYVGLVAAHAEAIDPTDPETLRIHGRDFLADLADDHDALRGPVAATFALTTLPGQAPQVFETDDLHIQRARHAEAYYDESDEAAIRFGFEGDDFLARLEALHGQRVVLTYRLTGYVPPLVTATLAHYYGETPPGTDVTVPLTVAHSLARGGRLITEHMNQVKRLPR